MPCYVEAGYSLLGRSPVVDAVLGDPFYLPTYAHMVTESLKGASSLYQMSTRSFIAGGIPTPPIKLTLSTVAAPEEFKRFPEIYLLWQAYLQVNQEVKELLLAAYYLAKAGALQLLQPAFESPFEEVRYLSASGLQDSPLSEALALVTPLFDDASFYVRRAAALTAISLKEKQGIPVLLETLHYDTLDTTENYGDNIYAKLAHYVGVDFGLDKQAWLTWWEQNQESFAFPGKCVLIRSKPISILRAHRKL